MAHLATKLRRKYIRPVFAAGLDLAARSGHAFARPKFSGICRVRLAGELAILRLLSLMLGTEESFMTFYRFAEESARRVSGPEKPA
jgi:hypothetical protein